MTRGWLKSLKILRARTVTTRLAEPGGQLKLPTRKIYRDRLRTGLSQVAYAGQWDAIALANGRYHSIFTAKVYHGRGFFRWRVLYGEHEGVGKGRTASAALADALMDMGCCDVPDYPAVEAVIGEVWLALKDEGAVYINKAEP